MLLSISTVAMLLVDVQFANTNLAQTVARKTYWNCIRFFSAGIFPLNSVHISRPSGHEHDKNNWFI